MTMEMEFTQNEPFSPSVFTGILPVKTTNFDGISCLSFISSDGEESNVLASPYIFSLEQDINGYQNISETDNKVRNINTFMGKLEPDCKQYFINIWEEQVNEYWQLKYAEIWTCLSDIEESNSVDFSFTAYPNPFEHEIEFSFVLEKSANVNLVIYDLLGNNLTKLVEGNLIAGNHLFKWNGDGYPNGMYFVSLQTNSNQILKKITLAK